MGHWATCKGSCHTKIEFFYHKLDAEYFSFNNFFEKSSIFRENREKLFSGHIWLLFRERRCLVSKINIFVFITNYLLNILLFNNFFKKKLYFPRNNEKLSGGGGKFFLKEKGSLPTKINITFFYRKSCSVEAILRDLHPQGKIKFWFFTSPPTLLKHKRNSLTTFSKTPEQVKLFKGFGCIKVILPTLYLVGQSWPII